MKLKLFSLLLASLLAFSLASCEASPTEEIQSTADSAPSAESTPSAESQPPQILTKEHVEALVRNNRCKEAYQLVYLHREDPVFAELLTCFRVAPQAITEQVPGIGDAISQREYDSRGNLIGETVDFGNQFSSVNQWEYDHMNNIVANHFTDMDGRTVTVRNTYQYDNKGNVLEYAHINAVGETQFTYTYTYDEDGNLLREVYSGAYSYTRDCTYDEDGRLLKEVYADGNGYQWTTHYTYDGDLLVTAVETPSGGKPYTTEYTYDHKGNLLTQTGTGEGMETYSMHYVYDAAGRMVSFTHIEEETTLKTEYEYDEMGVLLREIHTPDGRDSYVKEYSDFLYFYRPGGFPKDDLT